MPDEDDLSKLRSQILIIDDDQFNIEAMNYLLQQFNLKANYAKNAHEAYEVIRERLNSSIFFSLILVDYSMPNIDGLKCCQQIREMIKDRKAEADHQNFVEMPFISMVTAYRSAGFLEMANSQPGIDCVLTKPIFKE